jgi:sugar lactone lactonase YvrE
MHDKKVIALDMDGNAETIVEVENLPSGLGWLPEGDLLIVSMIDRRLLKFDGNSLSIHADLYDLADFHCNDMVVDREGNAYVGNFGSDLFGGEEPVPTNMIKVTPSGEASVVAEELVFPNGAVITPDGKTLIVAETFANQLTAFDIKEDKTLENRRIWARLEGYHPDGIALDPDGEIWAATPLTQNIIRVKEGGEITAEIKLDRDSFACAVGGENSDILFICTAKTYDPEETITLKSGCIETVNL